MSTVQMWITIACVTGATILTRFLPYILFPEGKKIPDTVNYLGKVLGPAVFGLLIVYCFRNVSWTSGTFGLPELIAAAVTVVLYIWKRGMILPMAGGTICYMILIRTIF